MASIWSRPQWVKWSFYQQRVQDTGFTHGLLFTEVWIWINNYTQQTASGMKWLIHAQMSDKQWISLLKSFRYSTDFHSELFVLSLTNWPLGDFNKIIFKLILVNDGCDISSEIALRWTSLDLSDDKSTLFQVMAWCRQATSHYLNQCWPRSLPPYGVTMS